MRSEHLSVAPRDEKRKLRGLRWTDQCERTEVYFSQFGGNTSINKHPERTNPAHIRSMQYFMNQGQTFEEAHESAIAYGFEPDGGVMAMDLDRRVNYLGQVPATDATAASHTIPEQSSGRKMVNAGLSITGLGGVVLIGGIVGLVVLSRR